MTVQEIYVSSDFDPNPKEEEIDCNDVIVTLNDGRKFLASFFTYKHIEKMSTKLENNGVNNKKYFWASNMVLIEDCSFDTLKDAVNNMIEVGDFLTIFKKIN